MNATLTPTRGSIWLFGVLPPVILNLGAILLFGGYYALLAINAPAVQGISPAQVQFAAYMLVFLVEWAFALLLIARKARQGERLRHLLAPAGDLFDFRKLPALAIFLFVNAVLGAYVWVAVRIYGQWPRLDSLQAWQRLFLLLPVPITAAFCEELIWRGHLIPELESRKKTMSAAIVLSALSFAAIHNVFLVDKVIMTFILGLGMGFYFTRERNLLPLMFSHFVADLWTFGLSVL
jgi:membrane protease YdiL (CAAX protease family)